LQGYNVLGIGDNAMGSIWEMKDGQIFIAEVEQFLSDRKKETPTLRDTFAMNAMNGMISNGYFNSENPKVTAELAYKIADAMMEVRK
jgi:hypothetical protein